MDRDEIRAFAAEQNGGVDLPEPGYDIDPTSSDPQHWLAVARHAKHQRDTWMLGWMWRHCPDVPAPGYRYEHLPQVMGYLGLAATARNDRDSY